MWLLETPPSTLEEGLSSTPPQPLCMTPKHREQHIWAMDFPRAGHQVRCLDVPWVGMQEPRDCQKATTHQPGPEDIPLGSRWGYLAAADIMVNDLSGDGAVHEVEEQLGVAVGGHAAIHHHEGTFHCLPPPGMVLLRGQREKEPLGAAGAAPDAGDGLWPQDQTIHRVSWQCFT